MFLLFKQELAWGEPPKGGQWRMQILLPIFPRSSFFVQHSTKVHRLIRTQLLVSWLGRDLPLIFIPKPPINEQVPTRQIAKHLDITTVFTYSHAKMLLGANQSTHTILVILWINSVRFLHSRNIHACFASAPFIQTISELVWNRCMYNKLTGLCGNLAKYFV